MKKLFVTAFSFLLLMCSCAVHEPILKVGILSDIHAYPTLNEWATHNLAEALDMLADKEVDLLLLPGDIAEGCNPDTYRFINKLCQEKFGKKQPLRVFCDGNHDRGSKDGRTQEEKFADFCQALGQSSDNPYHAEIKGYDFVALSSANGVAYTDEALDKTDALLKKLTERSPDKPVFVLSHFPPVNTMIGSRRKEKVGFRLREIFNKYPQVISLSGHTHCPLRDERSIWQGEFTAIQTSTVSYGCMEEEMPVNAIKSILPFAREVTEMLYMELFPNKAELRRYNVTSKQEIAPDKRWVITLPYNPKNAVYTAEKRKNQATAPEFDGNAKMLLRYDYGFIYLAINQAKHGDFPQFYDVEISEKQPDGQWAIRGVHRYVSDFYRLPENRAEQLFFKLPPNAVSPGKDFRFRVYPVETFGTRGKPLENILLIPSNWKCDKPQKDAYPQE